MRTGLCPLKGEIDISLEEILIFVTGADCPPPLGFLHHCTIDFFDQEPGARRLPYASTCSLTLTPLEGLRMRQSSRKL
ncbi:hypothetical protein AALO_G00239610 [Alosa alosa]|uniref:Uncharacterized protein n=1 Tax=Alosa alosa TaxID=278164 RepID=A0AAV6FW56_9TELE|nr:hypothetical protein AALO_G00239610 [Alosa alosa]